MKRFGRGSKALFILSLSILAACGEDDPTTPPSRMIVPESWRGIWRVTYTEYSCADSSMVDVPISEFRTACPGQTLEDFLGIDYEGLTLSCGGEFGDTELTARCVGTVNLFCDWDILGDLEATRVDSVLSGNIRLRATCEDVTECSTFTLDGIRTDPSPAACDSAATMSEAFSRFLRRPRAGS